MAVRASLHYALEITDMGVGEQFYRNFELVDKPARDERGGISFTPFASTLAYV